MASLKVKKTESRTIDLNGLYGTFYVEEADIRVHYFSTFASPSRTEGGHFDLLSELEPMRDRVESRSLKNLDSLLQRDLSDERIAEDLIPYLRGKGVSVGFFPPIVAVLMPKGFVQTEKAKADASYPDCESSKSSLQRKYGAYWTLNAFPGEDGEASRLGTLSIAPAVTDLVVLDGQHRANAFRYVSGSYRPTAEYRPFYARTSPIEGYASDLPVTIIWFEARKGKVQPTDISRELFVAVNNNARRVSQARTVLLDDVAIVPLAVNSLYRRMAEGVGFSASRLSLLTACFDLDTGLSDTSQPAMGLTNPVRLADALTYAFFGNAPYDRLKDRATKHSQRNLVRFRRIFGSTKYAPKSEDRLILLDEALRGAFRRDFLSKYAPVLDALFTVPSVVKAHYVAGAELEMELRDPEKWAPEYLTWWEKAFVGGEGLYSAYMVSDLDACKQVRSYLAGINKRFRALRAEGIRRTPRADGLADRQVAQIFESFNTTAFQTGYVMAVDYLAREKYGDDWERALKAIAAKMEKVTPFEWATFFGAFREAYIGSLDPASWPAVRKMLLVLLGYGDVFGGSEEERPPEEAIVHNRVWDWTVEEFSEQGEVKPAAARKAREKAVEDVESIYSDLGVKAPDTKSLEAVAQEAFEEALKHAKRRP